VSIPANMTHESLLKAFAGRQGKATAKIRLISEDKLAIYIGRWNQDAKEFKSVSTKIVLDRLTGIQSIDTMWHVRAIEGLQHREEGPEALLGALSGNK
jgi:hypothetical protein